ncbi:MAG: InlB B-repeat-containing protein [Treponema sp.]|nr:InlB B-repeat-containing protein [Treponema sp.]
MKRMNNILIKILMLLSFSVLIIGCRNMTADKNEKNPSQAFIKISVGEDLGELEHNGRFIFPDTDITQFTNFKLILLNEKTKEQTEYNFDDYDSLLQTEIGIPLGEYRITLSTGDFSDSIATKIVAGINKLYFVLKYNGSDTCGNLEVTIKMSESITTKLVAKLCDPITEMPFINYEKQLEEVDNSYFYSISQLLEGNYLLKIDFYENENVLLDEILEAVCIEKGLTSNKTINISIDELNFRYSITYELGDGTFVGDFIPTTAYTYLSEFDLPERKDMSNSNKIFEGWYETSDFSSERIRSIGLGTEKNFVLYAKWSETAELVENDSLYNSMEDFSLIKLDSNENIKILYYFEKGFNYHAMWCDYNSEFGDFFNNSNYTIVDAKIRLQKQNDTSVLVSVDDESSFDWVVEESGYYIVQIQSTDERDGYCGLYLYKNPKVYEVIYNCNEGTVSEGYELVYQYTVDDSVSLPKPPYISRIGYDFGGWYTTEDLSGEQIFRIENGSTEDFILYAKWIPVQYDITYNLNGGLLPDNAQLFYSVSTDSYELPIPTKEGYVFKGWYLQEDYSGFVQNELLCQKGGNKTYYAKWVLNYYSVEYELNGGLIENENISIYTIETSPTVLNNPYKNGYTFGGWYTNESFEGEKVTEVANGTTGDITLYAKWELNTYSIVYNLNEGSFADDVDFEYSIETSTLKLPIPVKEDYVFVNWYTSSSFEGEPVSEIKNTRTGTIELYAKWVRGYSIKYVTDKGTIPTDKLLAEGTELSVKYLPLLGTAGWKFLGWYTSEDYEEGTRVDYDYVITENLILYAKWEEGDDFVYVEGTSVIGSSKYNQEYTGAFPSGRTVVLSDFYISPYETTKELYKSVMEGNDLGLTTNPSYSTWDTSKYKKVSNEEENQRAVEGVSWYDAVYFCNLYSDQQGLDRVYTITDIVTDTETINTTEIKYISDATVTADFTKNGYRLPTEAEWEYAARGGKVTYGTESFADFFAGSSTNDYTSSANKDLDSVGWYKYNICNKGTTSSTAPSSGSSGYGVHQVGLKAANELGLYDMSGNVWEWCHDWYEESISGTLVTDPYGPSSGTERVRRGGGWYTSSACDCAVSFRLNNPSSFRYSDIGFRLVRSAERLESLSINYSTEHGTEPSEFVVIKGDVITENALPVLSENGWQFLGWYTSCDFSDESKITGGEIITEDMVLFAKWEVITYTITYYTNGGKKNNQNPSVYTIVDEFDLKEGTFNGRGFAGWYTDENLTNKITKIEQGTTGDITLYARWGEPACVSVSIKDFNDIEITYERSGNYLILTGPDNFDNYRWQINNALLSTNSRNTFVIDVSQWNTGRYTVLLIALSSRENDYKSATLYIDIE